MDTPTSDVTSLSGVSKKSQLSSRCSKKSQLSRCSQKSQLSRCSQKSQLSKCSKKSQLSSRSGRQLSRLQQLQLQQYLPDGRRIPSIDQRGFYYDSHLQNVMNAKSRVDSKPPAHHESAKTNMSQVYSGRERADREYIARGNERLMKKLNSVYRSEARVTKYYKQPSVPLKMNTATKIRTADITAGNASLRKRIMERGPDPSIEQKQMGRWWKNTLTRMQALSKYPLHFEAEKDLRSNLRSRCFLDLSLDNGITLGRLVFELYGEICPKTCQHFLNICNGTNNDGLCYEGTVIHRITPGSCLHGGIATSTNEITKKLQFADAENYILNHDKPGILSMDGRAQSQFIISFNPLPQLDGKKVVFGRVICGMKILRRLEEFGTPMGKPKQRIYVSQSGQLYGKPCDACVCSQHEDNMSFI